MVHGSTAKQPYAEWEIEKTFLTHYIPYTSPSQLVFYTLRKDNTISWKGNFYSVPLGTYKGRGSKVSLSVENNYLLIKNMESVEICRHPIAAGKGLKIKNTDHSRDKSAVIKEMMELACSLLDHPEKGLQFLSAAKTAKPRYIRDQVILFRNVIEMGGIFSSLDQLILKAEKEAIGYMDYTINLLGTEAAHREQNDIKKRIKEARLPRSSDLAAYDYGFENGLSKTRLNQLRELNWLDQIYNIILMGPSGTGKTFLAAGLCSDAVQKGYKAYFRTMEELINMLKMKDFTKTAMAEYKRLSKASLIVIDDIMLFPVEKNQAVNLFNFINNLYEKTSFIITTNKKPTQWATMLND